MDDIRVYHRGLYRLSLTYPAMYCITSTVGEGTITNLSAMGCSIETDEPLLTHQHVALRLLLPDKTESLAIGSAEVKWVKGTRAGVEFIQVEREANCRFCPLPIAAKQSSPIPIQTSSRKRLKSAKVIPVTSE
jgi:PilZ domain-containing protein